MLHSLEQRYVKLRDEHSKVKQQRDELLGKESNFESRLAEEQRASREVCFSELSRPFGTPPHENPLLFQKHFFPFSAILKASSLPTDALSLV
jgi:hypothetical protein